MQCAHVESAAQVATAWALGGDSATHNESDSDGYVTVEEDSTDGDGSDDDVPMHWYWQEDHSRIDSHPDDMRKGLFVAYGVKTSTVIEQAYQVCCGYSAMTNALGSVSRVDPVLFTAMSSMTGGLSAVHTQPVCTVFMSRCAFCVQDN